MDKNFDFEYAEFSNLGSSWSVDEGVNNKYLVWVSDYEESEEKEFYVLENIKYKDLEKNNYAGQYVAEKEYVIKYSYTGPWKKGKTFHAISRNGRYVCAAFTSKYGIRCYDSETSGLRWENKKIKSIETIKFNRFTDYILEVWNKKAEVTYINAEDGTIIPPDEHVLILQQSNYIRTSNDQKYVMIADNLVAKEHHNAMYSVYEIETNKLMGRFFGIFSLNADFGITNDGKYAFVSEYDRYGISMVDVSNGETIWNNSAATHIRQIVIKEEENEIIAVGNNRANKVLEMKTGAVKINNYAEFGKIFINKYGEDIVINNGIALIGFEEDAVTVKSPSFAYTYAFGTPHGFAVSAAGDEGCLQFYDYNGNLLWENKEVRVSKLAYVEKQNVICGYNMAQDIRKIWVIDISNGSIRKVIDAENCVEVFFDNNSKLLCSTGMIYDILQDDIVRKRESFKFRII